ncbi:uncharacterized protein [Nicotiana tomentosiformis]|uniref:uncharacterized protein n=1 Tax=Nicotiana tomentosiformis TaxID=4098 RepID=UPI00051C3006|nr:uncharacterized protein LOC104119169 [Nicotiana tomentosiformis]XP_016432426.1 PREDICTED: uncharacterized protein LOC107759067 [Nicotiana tabacum]
MMGTEDKTLFCFCHWGGKNKVLPDGSTSYVGGITDQIIVKTGIKYNDFVNAVFDRLGIDPSDKVLQFTVKFDRAQLIRLRDQEGVDTLLQFNDGFAHVYASTSEKESNSAVAPNMDTTRVSTTEVEAVSLGSAEEEQVSADTPTPTPAASHQWITDGTPDAASNWSELLVGEGQAFENADAFRLAVFKYSIANKFHYRILHNKPRYISIHCAADGCPWKVSAGIEKKSQNVSIRKFVDSHSHPPLDSSQLKPRIRMKWLGGIMQEEILGSPDCLPRKVCEDAEKNLAIKLTYRQAWSVKQRIREAINEKSGESYKLIPWLCNRLTEAMPGTIATWSCTEENRFKRLFVSYDCSIRGFHVGCRPLIFIDVYNLNGLPNSSFIVASALDADNQMYPLSYGVLLSMNEDDLIWFLEKLKLVVQNREVVIVSGASLPFLSSLDKMFGDENHSFCFHCVKENFNKFVDGNTAFKVQGRGKEIALKYLTDIAYARTLDSYNESLGKICSFRRELYDWVIASQPERWSNALFRKPRWDQLNCNSMDALNSFLEEEKFGHVLELMEAYHEKLYTLLQNNKLKIEQWNLPIGPRVAEKIFENQKVGDNLAVTVLSDIEFKLRELQGREEVVNLKLWTCTCLEWQMTGIPCSHACSAITLADMNIFQYVADWYKRETQEHIYAEVMDELAKFDIPHPDDIVSSASSGNDVVLCPLSPHIKRPPGRPRKEPKGPQVETVKRPIRCSKCGGVGHNKRTKCSSVAQ